MAPKLGIVAGGGALPAKLAEKCREIGRPYFVLAIEGEAEPSTVAGSPHAWIRLGAAGTGIRLLKEQGVVELVMAGALKRPSLSSLRPDWRAAKLYAKVGLRALGDDGLLTAVIKELESEGFTLVGVDSVLTDAVAFEGLYGRHKPDAQAEVDIAHGFRIVETLGALDIGQAAIVQQGVVLGVEAIEGTDALIRRCGEWRREGPGGVLVKAKKPEQERRADLPTIGPQTIELAYQAGLRGIAIEAGGSLVIDRETVKSLADKLGLFVMGCRKTVVSDQAPLYYLIAGEPSGDVIGARLMRALRLRLDGKVRFAGIGGERMAEEGLVTLLPIRELAIMGIVEIAPQLLNLIRRIKETIADIEAKGPVAVVTIDSSGFCFRVTEKIKEKSPRPVLVHYVAPMVWAWRAHRAFSAAKAADHLLTLLPFEPPYFEPVKLPATYVGHPVIEGGADKGDGLAFRARHGIAPDATVLCALPGSRRGEIKRLLPVFRTTVGRLLQRFPDLVVVVPTVETVADHVAGAIADWPGRIVLVRGAAEKFDSFAASNAALAASGTVALELAMAQVPMVIGYRIWGPTHFVVSRTVKIKYATLINLLLDRPLIPELLQHDCTPERLSVEIERLLTDPAAAAAQIEGAQAALLMIGLDGEAPSLKAADKVLELASAGH